MQDEKDRLLNEAYQHFIQYGFGDLPVKLSADFVAEDIMSYGTAIDEKVFSRNATDEWINSQRKHSEGLDIQLSEIPVSRRISAQEDTATIVSEFVVSMMVEGKRNELFMRLTTVMEFINGKWLAVHTHASKPDLNSSKSDPLHINEWKRKNEELQRLVEEQTSDLELKNKELVLEGCLERVRAQALSMKVPEDMPEVCRIIAEQLILLGVKDIRNIQTAIFYPEKGTYLNFEYYCLYDKKLISEINFKLPEQEEFANKMMNEPGTFLEEHFSGKVLSDFLAYQKKTNQFVDIHLYTTESVSYYFYSLGPVSLGISTYAYLKPGDLDLMKRFCNVFELAYTRFLDIQQAETMARQAMIELALERVRARTMAMQKSDELPEAANLLFKQVQSLGMPAWSAGYCIWDDDKKGITLWMSSEGVLQPPFRAPVNEDPSFIHFHEAYQRGETFYVEEIDSDALETHYRYMRALPVVGGILDSIIATGHPLPAFQIFHCAYFLQGFLLFITYEPVPGAHEIFKRFAVVFEQTYTRFLDLKKAEAQAREAQIEAALERVRSRSMAMNTSDELLQVITVVSEQLQHLNFRFNTVSFAVNNQVHDYKFWFSVLGNPVPIFIQVPYIENPMFDRLKEVLGNGINFYADTLTPEENRQWHEHVFANADFSFLSEETKAYILRSGYARSIAIAPSIMLIISNYAGKPYSEAENEIIKRFVTVFEQAYTRFLDLQKAEAQAREANIELGLERVRTRAMAMRNSEDLNEMIGILFSEMTKLDLALTRCIIMIFEPETNGSRWYMANAEDPSNPDSYYVKYHESPPYQAFIRAWKERKHRWQYALEGKEKVEWDDVIFNETELARLPDFVKEGMRAAEKILLSASFNNFGCLNFASLEPLSDEHFDILLRFAKVFDLTYTRFNDLQLAETQTHKANIEVALERVRARALAMQEPEELVEVANVMRHEMGLLGVEELETSSIYINKENPGEAECWYSLKDAREQGKKKVSDHFNLNYHDTWVGRQMLDFHQSAEKVISIVMKGEHRKEWINYCARQSPVFQGYYGEVIPDRTYHLCKFSNGAIGAATPGDISSESWELLGRAASVFSLAYSRFKDLTQARIDLQKLKEEKQRAETALADLKDTQTQLIQAEKMASLGEMTAGIAHEIQNPLNFVNNFSEVNAELSDEILEAAGKGNIEEVMLLAADIKSNQEKIREHGKRADAIVKGMLQHSRSSSGEKILTDINALADEYLRLAYHGIRAKDNTFNARLETDFDQNLGKLSIVPQDMGRVMLNLFTNAFYAVSEKQKLKIDGYEPEVMVSTKKLNDKVQVEVRDNGIGIPESIAGKIFQPFFTTKPSGQGTGLGLSLSYDVVKAHGGELKLTSKEGEGSEFIIQLRTN